MDATPVKVYADASTVFPIIARKSFYAEYIANKDFYDKKENPEAF